MNSVAIVGGFPWAGTRQFTDIMNASGLFDIRGEVYGPSFKKLSEVYLEADKNHAGKWSEKNYKANRWHSVLNSIAGISKGYNEPFDFSSEKILGFKTPWIENHKDSLDSLFNNSRVDFFCCLRSVQKNILSGMYRFGISLEYYEKRVDESAKKIEELCSDDRYRVIFLNLDSFVTAQSKAEWLAENLFNYFPGSFESHEDLLCMLSSAPNRNSSKSRTGFDKPNKLSAKDYDKVFDSDVLKRSFEKLEVISGHKLWV